MHLESDLWLPRPREEIFRFFSDAANLGALTPPHMRFRTFTAAPIVMRAGLLVDYGIRVHGIPIRWRSEITTWDPPNRFVDEQRSGPYRRWVHTHTFADERGGTRLGDVVEFEMFGGSLIGWFVMRDLRSIFEFRRQALASLFNGSG